MRSLPPRTESTRHVYAGVWSRWEPWFSSRGVAVLPVVGVAPGQRATTDPVAALNDRRELRGAASGLVFIRIFGSTVSLQRLSGHVHARMRRARAEAAGLDGTRITAHSMRAGHATTAAALAGVSVDRITAQTRHKGPSVLGRRYIRPFEALATTSSMDLGL